MSSVYNVFPNYWGTCVWTVTPPQTLGGPFPQSPPVHIFVSYTYIEVFNT